jgi:ankyrin repeat protein
VNTPDGDKGNALVAASASGHLGAVELLLRHASQRGETVGGISLALERAVIGGHAQVVELLLQNPAIIGAADCEGWGLKGSKENNDSEDRGETDGSLLVLAACYGHKAIVSMLLQTDAAMNVQDKLAPWEFDDALFAECHKGFTALARTLFRTDLQGYAERQTFGSSLKESVACNQKEVWEMLIREGVEAGFGSQQFNTAFKHACCEGSPSCINKVLENYSISNWPNCLAEAVAAAGERSKLRILMVPGKVAGSNRATKTTSSPLEFTAKIIKASENRSYLYSPSDDLPEVIKLLIEAGANVDNLTSEVQITANKVVASGRVDVLETIKSHEYNLFPIVEGHMHALLLASRRCQVAMVRYLLPERALAPSEVAELMVRALENCETCFGKPSTIEHTGCSVDGKGTQKCSEILRILLELNIASDFTKDGPLLVACQKGAPEAATLLLEKAKHSVQVIEDSFAAAVKNRHVDCVRIILEFESNLIDRVQFCTRYLFHSSYIVSSPILGYFLSHGVPPDSRNPIGEIVLYIAAKNRDVETFKVLLEFGADVSLEGGQLRTALHAAAFEGSTRIAKLLIDAEASIDTQSSGYGTPLTVVMAQEWAWVCIPQRHFLPILAASWLPHQNLEALLLNGYVS